MQKTSLVGQTALTRQLSPLPGCAITGMKTMFLKLKKCKDPVREWNKLTVLQQPTRDYEFSFLVHNSNISQKEGSGDGKSLKRVRVFAIFLHVLA